MDGRTQNNRYIVVVGCGRLGCHLANHLSKEGNLVVVIDKDEATFSDLTPDFSGFRINGDATHMAVLKQAKLKNADVLIATTHDENVNLMVAQVAKKIFSVPHVLARVFDPKREEIYDQLQVDTICPTSVAAEIFLETIANGKKPNNGVAL